MTVEWSPHSRPILSALEGVLAELDVINEEPDRNM